MADKRRYFGTDGIRGMVGTWPITPDFMLNLAHAVGRVLKAQSKGQERVQVLIGKDTRISGYMLESALESGFNSAGVDVLLLGPLPTPAVAYLTRAQRAALGIVISASHNDYPDNGVKFFNAQGSKLSDEWEAEVERLYEQKPHWVSAENLGRARRLEDATGRYIEFCKSTFASDLSLKGLKIVVDAAHGAAYNAAPKVLHELGADVISIGCQPDGLNINNAVGATHPQTLQQTVLAHRAHLGVALDGDGDRLLMVDAQGNIYDGDQLLYIMFKDKLAQGTHVAGVVGTLMTNCAIENAILAQGAQFERAQVGDRYVLERLVERGWILGGEGSGHILTLDKHTTGDGLIAALQVLQACVRNQQTLQDLMGDVKLYPQITQNIKIQPGFDWRSYPSIADRLAQVQHTLGNQGRAFIRPSGTEPKLRVTVESQSQSQSQDLAQELVTLIRSYL